MHAALRCMIVGVLQSISFRCTVSASHAAAPKAVLIIAARDGESKVMLNSSEVCRLLFPEDGHRAVIGFHQRSMFLAQRAHT
jgi:hypothetical protein